MKSNQDYLEDLASVKSMMEKSAKWLSLSGLSGILAGIYAIMGAYWASFHLQFRPVGIVEMAPGFNFSNPIALVGTAVLVLMAACITAIILSVRKAKGQVGQIWNPTVRRLIGNIMVPLVSGGLIMILIAKAGFWGWLAPFSLLFYGLALFIAGKFTYSEMKSLGFLLVVLGVMGAYWPQWGMLFWVLGFGLLHIIYGIYMHYRYER